MYKILKARLQEQLFFRLRNFLQKENFPYTFFSLIKLSPEKISGVKNFEKNNVVKC